MNENLSKLIEDHLADETFNRMLWVHVSAKGGGGQEVVNQLAEKLRETTTVGVLEDFSQLESETEVFIVPDLCQNHLYEEIDQQVLPKLGKAKKSYLVPFEIPAYRTKGVLENASSDLRKIKGLFYQLPSLLSKTATVISVSWFTKEGKIKVGICRNRMDNLILPFELTE